MGFRISIAVYIVALNIQFPGHRTELLSILFLPVVLLRTCKRLSHCSIVINEIYFKKKNFLHIYNSELVRKLDGLSNRLHSGRSCPKCRAKSSIICTNRHLFTFTAMLYILLYINAAAMMAHFLLKGLLQAASSHNQLSLLQT